jgi:hypothetical protein
VLLAFIICLAGAVAWAGKEPDLVDAAGRPVEWAQWLEGNGPAAVVVLASWAPEAERVEQDLPALARLCAERDLSLAVVGVHEPLGDTRAAMEGRGVTWFHDRHGSILKAYRLIRLPVMVILKPDGTVLARLDPSPAGLAGWRR